MKLEEPSPEVRAMMHLPRAHDRDNHGGDPCGCTIPQPGCFVCRGCGACYDIDEVSEFAVWRCYDCHRVMVIGE